LLEKTLQLFTKKCSTNLKYFKALGTEHFSTGRGAYVIGLVIIEEVAWNKLHLLLKNIYKTQKHLVKND